MVRSSGVEVRCFVCIVCIEALHEHNKNLDLDVDRLRAALLASKFVHES